MQPTGGCHFRTCSVWPDTAVRIPQWFIVQWTSIRLKRSTGCIWHRKSLSLYGGCDTRLSRVCLLCLWGWCVGASERHDEPEQNKNFGGLTFAKDASGAWGYRVGGADPVIPFKKGECQLVSIGTIGGNGSFSVPTKYQSNGIIAIPTTVTITTNSYGNCKLTKTFNGTSPAWSYNKGTGVVTTANSYWVICNDEGSIIYGHIAWTVYAIIVK